MIGKGLDKNNAKLNSWIHKTQYPDNFILLGEKNPHDFFTAMDLYCLSSKSEGFPNVVAEAMLCSTPVLSSDAGCSKKIINKYGFIMSHNNSETIVHNLKKTLNLFKNKKTKWKSLKIKSQNHIKKNYSIENMANSYLKEWVLN